MKQLQATEQASAPSGASEAGEDFSDTGKIGALYARLKGLLLDNRLRPGQRLMADELAERFGVSRTPVREALQRLSGESLVMSTPNRGHFSKAFDAAEQTQLYELAFAILKHAVQKNIGEFSLSGLNKPMDIEYDENGRLVANSEPFTKSHAMFIEQLYERITLLSGNKEMLRIIRNFIDRTHAIRIADLREAANVRVIAADMFDLIDVLVAGDVEKVVANLDRQMEQTARRMPELVRSANEDAAVAPLP
jgi:DNA-binding GntR family transcriptional regulator